jgi:flagellar hook-associated protein 3 FlgL
MSAQISDSLKIEYGINANDPAFQNLIGAMNLLSIGVQEKDDFLIQQSLDMSNKAINGLVGLRTKIGNCGKSLKSEKVSNIAVKNYLDEVKQGIIATDLSAASEKMHALVAGIQASYMATTKLNSMSIVDKMR